MKKQISKFLATLGIFSLLITSGCTAVKASTTVGPKFLSVKESLLGHNEEELIQMLDKPPVVLKDGCALPHFVEEGKEPVTVPGNKWMYRYDEPYLEISMNICVVEGYALAVERKFMIMEGDDGERITSGKTFEIDFGLIDKAMNGDLDGFNFKERLLISPSSEGIEI